MYLHLCYLRVGRQLLVQFHAVGLHDRSNVLLSQSLGESLVKVGINEGHEFLVL